MWLLVIRKTISNTNTEILPWNSYRRVSTRPHIEDNTTEKGTATDNINDAVGYVFIKIDGVKAEIVLNK